MPGRTNIPLTAGGGGASSRRSARAMALIMGALVCAMIAAADIGLPLPLRRILSLHLLDKLGHFLIFGVLSWLVVWVAIQAFPGVARLKVGAACSFILVTLAAVEEFSQNYIRTRTFSLWDLVASSAGIVIMAALQVWLPGGSGQLAAAGSKDRRA